MDTNDQSIRMAAFRFLEEQTRLAGEDGALRRTILERGFTYDGQRVPLVGPQGIFKPRVLASMIGIRPDCIIEVRQDVLDETDGPMLIHGLQGFHGARLVVPRQQSWRPDPRLLEERYERFRRAAT